MTKFIKAEDLKKMYTVKGRFYVLKSCGLQERCRSLLTITDSTISNNKKLLVIMLNPGSSCPLNIDYSETEVLSTDIDQLNTISLIDTKPDPTQYQVMRVMNEFQFSHADVINLFDIREPKSRDLFEKLRKNEFQPEASIFTGTRQSELNSYFTADRTVILAWGKANKISEAENTAIDKISKLAKRVFTVRGNNNIICHPSPQNHNYKLKWLNNICAQLRVL